MGLLSWPKRPRHLLGQRYPMTRFNPRDPVFRYTCNDNRDAAWKQLFNFFMHPYGGSVILSCNVQPKDVKNLKNVPKFYKDVMVTYYELIKPDEVDILCQYIWNNHSLRIDGVPCYFGQMFSGGMKLISDLFDPNGTVVPFSEWERRGVPRNCFLRWRSIISAIPTPWKQRLKHGFDRSKCIERGLTFIENGCEFHIENMTTKSCYQILIHRYYEKPTSQLKYNEMFDIDDFEWKCIYMLPFKCCHEVKTQMFQYKINMNCLMTNKRLCKMKIVDSTLCSLCSNYPETNHHLFFECDYSKHAWLEFSNWWEVKMNEKVDLNYKTIMFGSDTQNPDLLLNLCIILMKRMIYSCRYQNKKTNMSLFKYALKINYEAEKNFAMKNNTLHKFNDKWSNISIS